MELRRYLQIVGKRWWLVLAAIVATSSLTVFYTVGQPWIYESSGTFVVRPRAVEADELVRAFDTLNRSVEINETYARIAESSLVTDRARAELGVDLPPDLAIDASVVTGSNILQITVSGEDPQAVFELVRAAGNEAVEFVAELDDVFGLVPLEPAQLPTSPSSPNKPLTITLGVFLGLLLGIGLAVLVEYVRSPATRVDRQFDVFDPVTGTNTDEFFKLRFRQELSRSRKGNQTFTLAVLRVVDQHKPYADERVPGDEMLWQTSRVLENDLREEDILAYLGEGTFAVLLPDLTADDARGLLANWQDSIRSQGSRDRLNGAHTIKVSVGVCEYGRGGDAREWSEDELVSVLT